jgi:hypothetical protein
MSGVLASSHWPALGPTPSTKAATRVAGMQRNTTVPATLTLACPVASPAWAVTLEPLYAALAKERQREAGELFGRGKEQLVADRPQANKPAPKARDQAAKAVGGSGRNVSKVRIGTLRRRRDYRVCRAFWLRIASVGPLPTKARRVAGMSWVLAARPLLAA